LANINKNFTISCAAVGSPIPSLTIFRNREQPIIFNSSKFESDANKWIRIYVNGTSLPTNSDPDIERFGQFFFNQITKTITGQLIFPNIQEKDRGIYYCKAHNQHSTKIDKTELVIHGWNFTYFFFQDNQINSVFYFLFLAPPYVATDKMIVRKIEIAAGNSLSLTCPINGHPHPTISWLHVCNFSFVSKPPTAYFLIFTEPPFLSNPIHFRKRSPET
jgi:hypothetical protein